MGEQKPVVVVGAGLTGLVTALRLAQAGFRVEVYERYPAPGGLVATFRVGGQELECFYHHLFTTDREYVSLAEELGLGPTIRWLAAPMGIFTAGKLYRFGTPASLLRFAPFSLVDKLRFALSMLYLTRARRLERFEHVTAWDWVARYAGPQVLDLVWGPLLAQKFAERKGEISMAWLWKKVNLRGRSRRAGGLGEALGYMDGSFGRLVRVLEEKLRERGVAMHYGEPVLGLAPSHQGVQVRTRNQTRVAAAVVFTASPRELLRTDEGAFPPGYRAQLQALEATNAICLVLELSRPLLPYYWTSVADESLPFGGVIEHTNLVPAQSYGGRHVVYLSKYLFSHHPLWQARPQEVYHAFIPHLTKLQPAFRPEWILDWHLFRAADAQPVVTCNYREKLPPAVTPIPGLFHCSMAHIYPEDRGQNYAVREAQRLVPQVLDFLKQA